MTLKNDAQVVDIELADFHLRDVWGCKCLVCEVRTLELGSLFLQFLSIEKLDARNNFLEQD